jgi:hypothetical protein
LSRRWPQATLAATDASAGSRRSNTASLRRANTPHDAARGRA